MGNCLWANARSRIAYRYFGDAVTFDTIYQTNTYKMPFVPFTGVNHHHQSVMFGYALLVNETIESYTWLLKTWLNAMLGNPPSTIITNDDKAMAKAIAMYYLMQLINYVCGIFYKKFQISCLIYIINIHIFRENFTIPAMIHSPLKSLS